MNPELSQYITELKVQFQYLPRPYQELLQDIASKVPLLAAINFCQTSEISTTMDNAAEGNCPENGSHDVEGKLFIGKYPFNKWKDESVRPHWDEICAARNTKRFGGQQEKIPAGKKRTAAALENQLSQLTAKQYKMEARIASLKTE